MSRKFFNASLLSVFLAALALVPTHVTALPTDFDSNFGNNGEARWNTANGATTRFDSAESIIRDSRGRLYVASRCQQSTASGLYACLSRLTESGALDTSFGSGGVLVTANLGDDFSYINGGPRLAFQSSGRLILAAQCSGASNTSQSRNFCVERYLDNGTLDGGFGSSGRVSVDASGANVFEEPTALVIDPLDRIVVGGNCANLVNNRRACAVRLTASGALDTSYGNGGRAVIGFDGQGGDQWINAMALAGGSSVVFAATCSTSSDQAMCVGKLGNNGHLVTSFGGASAGGRVTLPFSSAMASEESASIAVQSDGKIVVGGTCYVGSTFCLARLNADGTTDTTFDSGFSSSGVVRTPFSGHSVAMAQLQLLPDGRILAVGICATGNDAKICAARYQSSGRLDRTFTATGTYIRERPGQRAATSVSLDPEGGWLVTGRCRNAIDSEFDSCVFRFEGGPVSYSTCSLDIDGDGVLNNTDALVWSRLMFGSDSRFIQGLSFASHATRSAEELMMRFATVSCRMTVRQD